VVRVHPAVPEFKNRRRIDILATLQPVHCVSAFRLQATAVSLLLETLGLGLIYLNASRDRSGDAPLAILDYQASVAVRKSASLGSRTLYADF
jgi:hypothetical protein